MQEYKELVEEIYKAYGYDYRDYSPNAIKRRVDLSMWRNNQSDVRKFGETLVLNPAAFSTFVKDMSVGVTEMFRNPNVFNELKEKVFPILATYPNIRVWSAGCSSGEEIYSLAIMLKEEGLYERSLLYATDINPFLVDAARKGTYHNDKFEIYESNYSNYNGKKNLSDYFMHTGTFWEINEDIRKNIVFSTHNLATDSAFNEFHLILCRNVVIYFNSKLTERVISLFNESLASRAFLCMGDKESLSVFDGKKYFDRLSLKSKIYKKVT